MLQTLSDTVRSTLRAKRRPEIESFIRHYSFPPGLRKRVADSLGLRDPAAAARVLLGLKEYFQLCLEGRDLVLGMPSQAVDTAWHEFILYTRDYTAFCQRAFGHYLHHVPGDEPSVGDDFLSGAGRAWMDLGRTWVLSCIRTGQDPRQPKEVPLLFSLDAEVGAGLGRAFTLQDLAALPVPPGIVETEPGRYRYIPRKNRKPNKSVLWGFDGPGTGAGCSSGNCSSSSHGHGAGCSGSCSSGSGCSGGGGN